MWKKVLYGMASVLFLLAYANVGITSGYFGYEPEVPEALIK
ncbi:MAG: cyclic lactone autoinducer peptide [Carboxydocellales bacterium]|jgi:cyclic lactone autoinducer peptide